MESPDDRIRRRPGCLDYLRGGEDPSDGAALLSCPHPFGQWWAGRGGRAYRGLRTHRYTYVRALEGPWLLYDNHSDPYQLDNLIGKKEHRDLLREMDQWLQRRLDEQNDEFLPSPEYIRKRDVETIKIKMAAREDEYAPVVPVVVPELDEVRVFAHQLHVQGKEWKGEAFGWSAEYNPERPEPPLDSKMTFTPADFCIGESGIWFFSLMWERGKNAKPVEFLDNRNIVGKLP